MGLLTCGRCGCTITAERKKAKYTYYRCTGFRGACGNSYVREERLADLLGDVLKRIDVPEEVAARIAEELRANQSELERTRQDTLAQLAQRRRNVQSKLDRAYDDYLEGRLSEALWTRKSAEWESELVAVDAELGQLSLPMPTYAATAGRILELAKNAYSLYCEQDFVERRRLLDTVLSNCTFDRGTLCPTYVKPFDLLSRGRETGDWRGGRDSNPRPPA
jgi:site-specific DNA recombinase